MRYEISPVDAIMGRLVDRPARGPYRYNNRYGRGAGSRSRNLVRATTGRPSAVFKLIKKGGCADRKGLKGQLDYVFSKAERVLDSQGRYEGQDTLSDTDMNRVTRQWSVDWWGTASTGYTSHLLLSYPVGTSPDDVAAISKAVCEEKFQSGKVRYDYVAGLHTDRDHPHVHVIVNRRGSDNRLLTLRQGTDMSYQGFREAMVAHGEALGVHMASESRFDKGLVHRAPTTREIYDAKVEGREPRERVRTGPDLAFALGQIEERADIVGALSVLAAQDHLPTISRALQRAETLLRNGETILGGKAMAAEDTDIVLSEAEVLDARLHALDETLNDLQVEINEADPALRPGYQQRVIEIMAELSVVNPGSAASQLLRVAPGEVSPYHAGLLKDAEGLSTPQLRQQVGEILDGTGINADEVLARIEVGAEREYLERAWTSSDVQKFAAARNLDLYDDAQREQAVATLSETYHVLRQALEEANILHETPEDAVLEEVNDRFRVETDARAEADALRAQAGIEGIAAFNPEEWNATDIVEKARAEAISDGIQAEVARLHAQGHSRAYISERSFEIGNAVTQRIDTYPALAELAPEERRDFEVLERRFAETDFTYGSSDDPIARDYGRAQVDQARSAFEAYAARSSFHAELASRAWDVSTDSVTPPGSYVREDQRRYIVADREETLEEADLELKQEAPADRAAVRRLQQLEEALLRRSRGMEIDTVEERAALAACVREQLSDVQIEEIKAGRIEALAEVTDDPADQNYLALELLDDEIRRGTPINERVLHEARVRVVEDRFRGREEDDYVHE
ncbi:relaxase/mobilization nuclease domain-containing protein [Primorskyibacter marinus]|uniref:relaxase/mobilization nuclease domain-containing protein n=1 Tax=Primorskyibacter marinus TaxID=1977320 RepID=UPI000E306764|nr:relaxase/mobilization nuclease domain-containing protein [Primorskyibacter marinus]